MAELAQDEDKEVIYAQVDVARNLKVARRFASVVFPPCILLFRDRQMYLFDQSFDSNDILEQVRDFVTSGFANANPLDVPEFVERRLNLEKLKEGDKADMRVVIVGALMILGGLAFQAWAIMNKDKFKPEPESEPAAAPAGAAGSAAAGAGKAGSAAAAGSSKPAAEVGGKAGKGKAKGKSS